MISLSGGDYSFLYLYFDKSVTVNTETPQYSYFTVLVDVGSALGLWLGLSAIDMVSGLSAGANKLVKDNLCSKVTK